MMKQEIKLLELLQTTIDMKASDLYLIPGNPATLRVEDNMIPISSEKLSADTVNEVVAIISQRLIPIADGNGRIPAVGIMLRTPRISDLIQKGDLEAIASAIEQGQQEGMISLDQAIYDLYKRQLISYDDALKFADSENNVRVMMRGLRYTTTR